MHVAEVHCGDTVYHSQDALKPYMARLNFLMLGICECDSPQLKDPAAGTADLMGPPVDGTGGVWGAH